MNISQEKLNKVMKLASAREIEADNAPHDCAVNNIASVERVLNSPHVAKDAFKSYLETLNTEETKDVIAIMYLGRDADYDRTLPTAEAIYNDQVDYMDKCGMRVKEDIIRQIVEKAPIHTYLSDGLKILEQANRMK